ncbi:MAG: VanZ family protein [Bacteroidia bacterium]|nr:VanZ family protein [Bacteroidia bacterium]
MFFKHIKWAMLWALFILVLCGIPGRDIPHISFLELLSFDKFVHAGVFFVLLLLLIRGSVLQTRFHFLSRHSFLLSGSFCVLYGGVLELMQEVVFEERSADLYDFIANSFGVLMGLIFYRKIEQKILIRFIK